MKQPKAISGYRRASKRGINCGTCRYMHDDGTCTKVIGIVDRKHVCNYFEVVRQGRTTST